MTTAMPDQRACNAGTLYLELEQALMIGGAAAPPGFLDAATARIEHPSRAGDEQPVLPATAVRGMLREALARLCQSQAGHGEAPAACLPFEPSPACTPALPCPTCRIFGRPGRDRPDLLDEQPDATGRRARPLGIAISDARLESPQVGRDAFVTRHGVAVSRKRGSASPEMLRFHQVAEVPGARFRARLSGWLTPGDRELLEQACLLADHIGGSASGGLGALRAVSIEWSEPGVPVTPAVSVECPPPEAEFVVVEACEDLFLGGFKGAGHVEHGQDTIPGSALAGALGWGLAAGHPRGEDLVARLRTDDGFVVSDLLPAGPRGDKLTIPAPRTLLACRRHPEVMVDRIVRDAILENLPGEFQRTWPPTWSCRQCDAPLRPLAPGRIWIRPSGDGVRPPARRLVTRLCRSVKRGSAAQGMLYVREQAAARSRFVGTCQGLDPELAQAFTSIDRLAVGGMRHRGLGGVRVRITSWHHHPVLPRIERFQQGARSAFGADLLRRAGLGGLDLVQVLVRTPLALPDGDPPAGAGAWVCRQLGLDEDSRVLVTSIRTGSRSGFDERRGGPRPVIPVLEPGSTWLLGWPPGRVSETPLHAAETRGVGRLRRLGLGRLYFCPALDLAGPSSNGAAKP